MVALVGPSGSGKTTLVSLIPRLYNPSEGHILVDGHDSSRYRLRTLREQVAFVLQDVIVLGHVLTADRILLLDHGELVAEGNHESLLVSSELYRLLATQLTR
jgi:ABC-type multidrug transport system fused ATPase/permease subunit